MEMLDSELVYRRPWILVLKVQFKGFCYRLRRLFKAIAETGDFNANGLSYPLFAFPIKQNRYVSFHTFSVRER